MKTRRRSGRRTRKARPSHSRTNDARDRAVAEDVLHRLLDRFRGVGEQVEVEVEVETKTEAKAEAGQRDEARSWRKAAPEGAASPVLGSCEDKASAWTVPRSIGSPPNPAPWLSAIVGRAGVPPRKTGDSPL